MIIVKNINVETKKECQSRNVRCQGMLDGKDDNGSTLGSLKRKAFDEGHFIFILVKSRICVSD